MGYKIKMINFKILKGGVMGPESLGPKPKEDLEKQAVEIGNEAKTEGGDEVKDEREVKEASEEDINKARLEMKEMVDVAHETRVKAQELSETIKSNLRRLRRIEGDLNPRDMSARAIRPLLEQTVPWFSSNHIKLVEQANELTSRMHNLRTDLDTIKPGDNQIGEIMTVARGTRDRLLEEIAGTARTASNYAEDCFNQAKGIFRRTENYLGERPDHDSSVGQLAAAMQRFQQDMQEGSRALRSRAQ